MRLGNGGYGRAIDFDAQVESDRFTWGQADIRFKVAQGIIADTVIFQRCARQRFYRLYRTIAHRRSLHVP